MVRTFIGLLILLGAATTGVHAAVLQVNDQGLLTGATGVVVGGRTYDVEFREGTCAAIFRGCDDSSDMTFRTSDAANDASQSLLDQVFINVDSLRFDSDPELTLGCPDISSSLFCDVITPFDVFPGGFLRSISANVSSLAPPGLSDFVVFGALAFGLDDTAVSGSSVFAVWTPSQVQPVSEPAALAMFAIGLIAGYRRLAIARC